MYTYMILLLVDSWSLYSSVHLLFECSLCSCINVINKFILSCEKISYKFILYNIQNNESKIYQNNIYY